MTETPIGTANYSDQSGIFNPDTFVESVTIIGCGGIGASLLPTLVTMGINKFVLYDPDHVEDRNIASQLLYNPSDIFKSKVDVCKDFILQKCPTAEVEIHKELFTADTVVESAVLISAVDSMTARQEIWKAVQQNAYNIQLLLDGRIGGEHMSLLAVDPLDGAWYENSWLFSNEEASPLPCTQRAIVYPAVILGAMMCASLAHWHNDGEFPPNLVEYSAKDRFFQEVRCNV